MSPFLEHWPENLLLAAALLTLHVLCWGWRDGLRYWAATVACGVVLALAATSEHLR